MITELTKKQESALDKYAQKWIDIGLRTKHIDEKKAEAAVNFLYDLSELERPKHIVFLDSPWECQIACNLVTNDKVRAKVRDEVDAKVRDEVDAKVRAKVSDEVSDKVYDKVSAKVRDEVDAKVRDEVDAKVRAKVDAKVRAKVSDEVSDKVYDKVSAKVRAEVSDKVSDKVYDKVSAKVDAKVRAKVSDEVSDKVYDKVSAKVRAEVSDKVSDKVYDKVSAKVSDKVYDKVYDKVRAEVRDEKLTFFWPTRSNMWMSWYSRFDFYFNEVLIKEKKNHKDCIDFLKHSQEFHQVYTFDDIAFVSDFPKEINTNDNGDLHDFNKASLIYRDGFAIYQSNGITMKEDYILTPADQITKEMYLKEDNADQKAEIVKKVGRDRMLTLLDPKYKQKLTTKLGGEYDLIDIEFSTGQTFPFLSMKCPSTGKTHILGVVDEGKDDIELAYAHLHNETNFKDINMVWEG